MVDGILRLSPAVGWCGGDCYAYCQYPTGNVRIQQGEPTGLLAFGALPRLGLFRDLPDNFDRAPQ